MVPSLPEGDNFTVGGCLGGLALGSNSYIHGFFNNNVVDFDIVLGNGHLVRNVSKKIIQTCITVLEEHMEQWELSQESK